MPRYTYDDDTYLDDGAAVARRPSRASGGAPRGERRHIAAPDAGSATGFNPTYRAAKHEAEWLYQSLGTFYDEDYITDVEALVKGGKEATVYRCTAHDSVGPRWLAAKVYRPRRFRALRNDSLYRSGRPLLNALGGEMKETDRRMARALDNRSSTAMQVEHTSWLMYEYSTLELLHEAGAAVPRPIAAAENALLMEYVGDDEGPAPTLNQVRLDRREASGLFDLLCENVELMLAAGFIHGDLSAYNVLYWEGDATIIDFPQVADAHRNPAAREIMERDVNRLCGYFQRQGVECDATAFVDTLWGRYVELPASDRMADLSRLAAALEPEEQ